MFVIHYGEIGIKGDNRQAFERRLASNIRSRLKPLGDGVVVTNRRGFITVEASAIGHKQRAVSETLGHISGIEYFYDAERVEPKAEAVIARAAGLCKDKAGSFRVTVKRADKSFPGTSQELAAKVGAEILNANPKLKVDLREPDHVCYVEVTPDGAYVASEKTKGVGGLPVGSSGRLVSMLSGGIDSPVASWMMLKRGAPLHFVSFHNFPYTDRSSIDIVTDIVKVLNRNAGRSQVSFFNLTPVQEEIVAKCDPRLRVLLYRRMMFRVAGRAGVRTGCQGFATGESLGQVASQTIENIAAVEEVAKMPILRPLIGMDKEEIIALAKRIGTYELSIRPHSDCCSLFVPDHPATKAKLDDILANEARLDIEALVESTLAKEDRLVLE